MGRSACRLLKFRLRRKAEPWGLARWMFVIPLILILGGGLNAQKDSDEIQDITGKYHFLSADDTLALLEEEGKLKGYVDVYQGEEESDTVLSYPITMGSRKKDRVEFKTGKIHQKYFRFSGAVERGAGHEDPDPDYLRLVGHLEIVTVKADTGEEFVQRMHVIWKSMGRAESKEN